MVAAVLMAAAALFFRLGSWEEVKAEVTLLNNYKTISEFNVIEKNEIFRATVTAKNAAVYPKKFYLTVRGEGNFKCEMWTAYQDQLLAEAEGTGELIFDFKDGVKLEKDSPTTWRVFCDLNGLAEGENFQAELKTDPATLEWESASRQSFREIKLLTEALEGPEISK